MAIDRTVIVTEDDDDIRECVGALLREEGLDTRLARDGRAALHHLDVLGDERCILLLDLMMPTMSGFDVIELLERAGRLPGLPVVVCTASKNADLPSGVRHLIRKPFGIDRLLLVLEDVCGAPTSGRLRCG